jgi:CRP-like cAMP-binding protein
MDKSILKNISLFSDLNDEELEKIYSRSDIKKFSKGEMIFFDTEPYQGFYIAVEGSVKIFKISKDGREHILYFIYPFNTFAEVPLLEQYEKIKNDEFTYPANAMSLEKDTKLILIRASVFYSILEKNKTMCLKMMSGLAKKLRHLNGYIENITHDVPKRIAKYLLAEQNKYSKESKPQIELSISKHDLAAYLGTIDETLSRALKKFQDDKLIKVEGKKIKINDISALKKIASS